jgi:DNA-binding MarR family transcriptional regulator
LVVTDRFVWFTFLEDALGLTRGNLSSHASKLEKAGYLEVLKAFHQRVPVTRYRITKVGRDALEHYRRRLRMGMGRPK